MQRRAKNPIQIHHISRAASVLYAFFSELSTKICSGMTGLDIQAHALQFFSKHQVKPALRGQKGFPADISVSINDTLTHGIPNSSLFETGDVVTVDCVVTVEGHYGDMAWTFGIPPVSARVRRLLSAAWQACIQGCLAIQEGMSIASVAGRVVQVAEDLGARVIDQCCGHGIGSDLHEVPIIPYTKKLHNGWLLQKNMVLNMEPVLTLGKPEVYLAEDGYSYRTQDGQPTAQYELSCLLAENLQILSLPKVSTDDLLSAFPPFY